MLLSQGRRMLLAAAFFVGIACAQTPTPVIDFVRGMDTNSLCPGDLALVLGKNLGPAGGGMPAGLTVLVNGKAAAITNAIGAEIQIQLPVDVNPGPAMVTVQYLNQSSAPYTIQLSAYAPGVSAFFNGLIFYGRAPGSVAPGQLVAIDATGLGPTNPMVATGAVPSKLVPTVTKASVTVGGESANVLFSGLTTLGPGVYVFMFTVPGDLPSGTYPLTLSIGGFNSPAVPLSVKVVGLSISQSGFTFQALQGGSTPPPEAFRLLNGNTSPLDFSLTTATVPAGAGWLSVSPASGTVAVGATSPPIAISVNPANLPSGDYYGQIRVDAPNAPNSPQFIAVVLNISATVNPGPVVQPTGLVFVELLQAPVAAQSVSIANLSNRPTTFNATGTVSGTVKWFTISPATGSVAPNSPATVTVQPIAGLATGIYRGTLTLQFPQDNTTRAIDLLLVVTPALNSIASPLELLTGQSPAASACTPTKLLPVFSLLGANFNTAVAWPTNLEVIVVDDCGTPMKTGSVVAAFSNGDAPLSLASLGDGHWAVTWTAVNPRTSSLVVTVTATQDDLKLQGAAQVGGAAQPNPDVPIIPPNAVVNAGSYASTATPSPGELVSVFGIRLADGLGQPGPLPLPTTLQNSTLVLGGRKLPLVFTNGGQVNAQIPYDLPPGTTQQIVVQHGNKLSAPQQLSIATAEPAIFTTDSSGKGQGHIYLVPPGQQILADASAPAQAGDVVVIYCTGLGPVSPAVDAGTATPFDALRNTTNRVTLSIGGVAAPVGFSGLVPGFAGLYQVNATVPAGVTPGNAVPVILSVAGESGPPVTMAVKSN